MPKAERQELIEQIQKKRGDSHVICCITSDRNNAQGIIAKDFLFRFFEHLRKTPTLEKLDIFLFTIGGDTLAAYALGRFIRQFSKNIGILIPHTCHSGGTLFALAANEIVMTRVATLSSIDPSIVGQLNPLIEVGPGQRAPVPVGVESMAGFVIPSTKTGGWMKKVPRWPFDCSPRRFTHCCWAICTGHANKLFGLHRFFCDYTWTKRAKFRSW